MKFSVPNTYPDNKVHGTNMGPIWGRQDPGGPHVGPMNLVIRDTLIARFIGTTWGPSGADRTQVGPMLAPWTLWSGYILPPGGQNKMAAALQTTFSIAFLWKKNLVSLFCIHWGMFPSSKPALGLSDAIWHRGYWSTLAPSHYLNHLWVLVKPKIRNILMKF